MDSECCRSGTCLENRWPSRQPFTERGRTDAEDSADHADSEAVPRKPSESAQIPRLGIFCAPIIWPLLLLFLGLMLSRAAGARVESLWSEGGQTGPKTTVFGTAPRIHLTKGAPAQLRAAVVAIPVRVQWLRPAGLHPQAHVRAAFELSHFESPCSGVGVSILLALRGTRAPRPMRGRRRRLCVPTSGS
jgi:hypothetical protein